MKITTLNKIHKSGTDFLKAKGCSINESDNPEMILVRSEKIDPNQLPKDLLVIARAGVGVNNIPIEQLTKIGVPVLNTPGANASAVRDIVFGSMICYMRNLLSATQAISKDNISKIEDIKKSYQGMELIGKTMLVIGLGAIGKLVAKTGIGFGINVVAYDPFISFEESKYCHKYGIRMIKDLTLATSIADIITIHVPLNSETKNIINFRLLSKCTHKPLILNFSRAEIAESSAVMKAIHLELISGYITDFPTPEIIGSKKTLCLPHIGATTIETEEQCSIIAARNAWEYLAFGSITSSVNFPSMHLGQPDGHRICLVHADLPNMLGEITGIIGKKDINIDQLNNAARAGLAYTIIDIRDKININLFEQIPGMIKCRLI